MQTHAERFRHMMQEWGLTQEELGNLCGIKRGTVGTIVNGKTVPDVEALARLKQAKPKLSWDWLLLGKGEMMENKAELPYEVHLRKAAALNAEMAQISKPSATPVPQVTEPAPDYTSAVATQQTLYIDLLKEQIADLKQRTVELKDDKARLLKDNGELREENKMLLGKPFDSPDAADDLAGEPEPDPTSPLARGVQPMLRPKVGFRTSYQD